MQKQLRNFTAVLGLSAAFCISAFLIAPMIYKPEFLPTHWASLTNRSPAISLTIFIDAHKGTMQIERVSGALENHQSYGIWYVSNNDRIFLGKASDEAVSQVVLATPITFMLDGASIGLSLGALNDLVDNPNLIATAHIESL